MHRPDESTPLDRARAVVAEVYERRRRHGHAEDLAFFPEPEDHLGVVAYLTKYQRAPDHVLRDDPLDQLRLLDHVMGEVERRRLAAIRSARRHGRTWSEIADALGLASRQGAEALLVRLAHAAAAPGNRKDDRQARSARRAARSRRTGAAAGDERAARFRTLVAALLDLSDQLPEDVVDDLRYLQGELDRGRSHGAPLSAGAEASLRLAVADIEAAGVGPAGRALLDQAAADLAR